MCRAGILTVLSGLLILTIFSFEPVANFVLGSLENRYSEHKFPVSNPDNGITPEFIVILGGGHSGSSVDNPLNRLTDASARRLMEGIRLSIDYPEARLLLSGGNGQGADSNAAVMADAAILLGVVEDRIILEDRSRDTSDEAIMVKELIGTSDFILVTSASHMPRSMAMFRKLGMNPVPSPTGKLTLTGPFVPGKLFPSSFELHKSTQGIYEYLGLVWGRLNGLL